jgi:hypothetical protein
MNQREARGWVVITCVSLLLLIWIISVIPSEVWIFLAVLTGSAAVMCLIHSLFTSRLRMARPSNREDFGAFLTWWHN